MVKLLLSVGANPGAQVKRVEQDPLQDRSIREYATEIGASENVITLLSRRSGFFAYLLAQEKALRRKS
jgi:hypothetical protein